MFMDFYKMPADVIAMSAESHAVCFLNTFKMRNDNADMKRCIERDAQVITACAESNRVVTIEAVARAICDKNKIYDTSLSTVLNLVLYTGLYHQPHRFNYATNTATVYLTARDGYCYELKGVNTNGVFAWSYERKKVTR